MLENGNLQILFADVSTFHKLKREFIKWNESKQLLGYIFTCCITLAPSSTLFAGFTIQSLILVLLCYLASRKEESSREYGFTWLQLRSLGKNLGRRGWGTADIFCHHLDFTCYNIGCVLHCLDKSTSRPEHLL